MNKADMLWDIEQIKQLKARYFRCADTHDYENFREVFVEDLKWARKDDNGQIDLQMNGREALVEWLQGLGPDRMSAHNGYMPEIEICDERTAKGIWGMTDYAIVPGQFAIRGYGHYHEKYVKGSDGKWRISELMITRIRVDQLDAD